MAHSRLNHKVVCCIITFLAVDLCTAMAVGQLSELKKRHQVPDVELSVAVRCSSPLLAKDES